LGGELCSAALYEALTKVVVGAPVGARVDRDEARQLTALSKPRLGLRLRDRGHREPKRLCKRPELSIAEPASLLPLGVDLSASRGGARCEETIVERTSVTDVRPDRAPGIPRPVGHKE